MQDEDLDRAFKRIGDQYSMPVDRVKEFFKSRDDLLPLMNEVLNEKILNFLKEGAQFQKPSKKDDKEVAADQPQEAEVSSEEKDE